MSDAPPEQPHPAEARVAEHLALLRSGVEPASRALVQQIVATARRQRVIRGAVRFAASVGSGLLGGLLGLLRGASASRR